MPGKLTTRHLPPAASFIALVVVSLIVWFRPLLETMSLALGDERYTHILLVLPITAFLIFQQWRWHREQPRTSLASGNWLLLALLLAGLARWQSFHLASDFRLAISMLGLVTWWIASFVICFGVPAFRSFLFPLGFLFWMVPLPAFILNPAVAGLQQGSALAAQALFRLVGTPVSLENLVLTIPGLELEVAPECSSIRSSLMLVVTAMVLAQILLRSRWRRLLVIAVTIPLSVAKNGLRIFTIGWLGTRVDAAYLDGRLHRQGGIVFFAVALAGIFLLLWILYRGERSPEA